MKRILVLLLTLCLVLSCLAGCKKNKSDDQIDNSGSSTTESSETTTESSETTTESSEETTEQEVFPYTHPLTGEPLKKPWSGQIVAVMTNNIEKSMPQHGLSQADIVYEMEEEGSITRNMALFSDVSKVDAIGSIRSARTYFVSVAEAFDAYLVHCGTSNHASNGKYDHSGHKVSEWKDLDQFYNSKYFYRDQTRLNAGYGWEHTLFTSGEKLASALEGKALSVPTGNDNTDFGLQFGNDIDLNGDKAEDITITFKGTRKTGFQYDATTKLYKRIQHGKDSIDGNTDSPVYFKNVIAIYTKQWRCSCENSGHQFYNTIGEGEGYAAINGQIVPIKWSRKDVNSPYTYTLEDGSPLILNVGTTYIAFAGAKYPIIYK